MADVRPFRALRYAPDLDLAAAICPPFDTISPEKQRALHERAPYNAVRIELAEDADGRRYERAAETLSGWRQAGTLRKDDPAGFYLYRQRFSHGGRDYSRSLLFARLRLEPWDKGIVLPHEQTFGGPKADRLKLLRATHLNASPVFLFYRDPGHEIADLLQGAQGETVADFSADDGQHHTLARIAGTPDARSITEAFRARVLYIADGHHRYETALGYRDEVRGQASHWTGEEAENFAMAALVAEDDPGLLVLPIHRVTSVGSPLEQALHTLRPLFDIEGTSAGADALQRVLAGRGVGTFALVTAEAPETMLLSARDARAVDRLLPQDRSPEWRRLDYAIANYALLRHGLGLSEPQMSDYNTLWFTEDAGEAVRAVRSGKARYAVIVNPVPVAKVLDVADAGERMPQKSTFFYPKVPTGLVFNPLED
jgi:uncharacterized protein (DUF1015 family)